MNYEYCLVERTEQAIYSSVTQRNTTYTQLAVECMSCWSENGFRDNEQKPSLIIVELRRELEERVLEADFSLKWYPI